MTVTISGTSGIVNDATDLNYTGTLTGGTGVVNLGSGQVYKDASGNVGIGSVPVNSRRLTLNTSGQTDLSIIAGSTNYAQLLFGYTGADNKGNISYYNGDNSMQFYTNGTERARIDSSGNLLVGRTTTTTHLGGDNPIVFANGSFSSFVGAYNAQYSSDRINFNNANYYVLNASTVGVRLGNGSTSWAAQSDERTKTNLVPITNGLEKVNTLRAVTGRYIKDEENISRAFLIAQDVKAVLPEAVDEDSDEEKTLGLRYTETIPLLVAAIKDLKVIVDGQAALITALTARITALETAA